MAVPLLKLGTRGSRLALTQAGLVRDALASAVPALAAPDAIEIVAIRTTGDAIQDRPLSEAGGKGLFVKEIEEALADGHVDAGVHSMKDLPARLAPGLMIGAVPERVDPRDVLVGGAGGLAGLPEGARVGTASPRRRAQLLTRRPDLEVVCVRGNVDTRLRRWRAGEELDALVLAAAGLARLGVAEPGARPLDPAEFVPAVGQGALALVCRAADGATREILAAVADPAAQAAVAAERAFLLAIGGDCNTPLAAHASVTDGQVALRVWVSDPDGRRALDASERAPVADAAALGRALAERLIVRGAAEIMAR